MTNAHGLDRLFQTIKTRRGGDSSQSWTAHLLAHAPELPARKLAEESIEVVIAAINGDRDGLTHEAADMLYHLMVVLVSCGVELDEIWHILESREKQSGLAEKASRQKTSHHNP